MIADKIALAKKEKQKKRLNLLAIALGAAMMAALLLYLITNFTLVSDDMADQNNTAQPNQAALVANENPAAVQTQPDNQSPQNTTADRQAYIAAFQHYQTTLKPTLDTIDLVGWDEPIFNQLTLLEKTALDQFSAGSYAAALSAINQLNDLAKTTLERSQAEYDDAIANVKAAYAALDYNMALLALKKATLHQQGTQTLNSLSLQVENIPKIQALEETIRIANIENDPDKELQAIKSLAALDGDWGNYKARAASIAAQLTTDRFNQAIARAYSALDNKQVSTAQSELNKARAISPSRKEIGQVSQAIATLNRANQLETNVANANRAAAADNWDKVSREITQALRNKPNDRLLTDRLTKANQITALKQQISTLLATPYRLANDAVKMRAKIALIKAESYASDSASLTLLSNDLTATIAAANKDVAVAISSDGLTSVSIRGVGIVGQVMSKTIQLRPGAYTFEGQRKGYKSKIIKVTIPLNKTSYQLTVIADERI